jgi:hypothetical protein
MIRKEGNEKKISHLRGRVCKNLYGAHFPGEGVKPLEFNSPLPKG